MDTIDACPRYHPNESNESKEGKTNWQKVRGRMRQIDKYKYDETKNRLKATHKDMDKTTSPRKNT